MALEHKKYIFGNNPNLFLEYKDLEEILEKQEYENLQLRGSNLRLKENEKQLRLFINCIQDEEIDLCLDRVNFEEQLNDIMKKNEGLYRKIKYLENLLLRCIKGGKKLFCTIEGVNITRNNWDISIDNLFENEKLGYYVDKFLKMLSLLDNDITVIIKDNRRIKTLLDENNRLKDQIDSLNKELEEDLNIIKDLREFKENSLRYRDNKNKEQKCYNIKKRDEDSKDLNKDKPEMNYIVEDSSVFFNKEDLKALKDESIYDAKESACACKFTCNDKDNDFNFIELDNLRYALNQYKKENYELKQQLFEYKYNEIEGISSMKEKQTDSLDSDEESILLIEKCYEERIEELIKENKELKKIIEIEQQEASNSLDRILSENNNKIERMEKYQIELVEDYEMRINEQYKEIMKLREVSQEKEQCLVHIECLKRNMKNIQDKITIYNNDNLNLKDILEEKTILLENKVEELSQKDQLIANLQNNIDNLKKELLQISDQYNNEVMSRQRYEQEVYILQRELDSLLNGIHNNHQSRVDTNDISEHESFSIEVLLKQCEELEKRVEELQKTLEDSTCNHCMLSMTEYSKSVGISGSSNSNVEVKVLADQLQNLKREREALKKDIRQRDWAKIEIELMYKKAIEDAEQLKRENARLMLENLKLRDSNYNAANSLYNENCNSNRASISSRRSSIIGKTTDNKISSTNADDGISYKEVKQNQITHNMQNSALNLSTTKSIMPLKAPKRPSLMFSVRK
ncbi:hypothetical protein cand_027070 [Cryptosporidium andersoni]|uniref:Uncharacterized protein n=1 Tax=Cryptosporidium andersoni TaxID=117008 RepID=A0A1J4MQB8_9CRYT|nr:hypothetical protein cand_027070 [Cryptosporidium andersoni]